MVAARVDTHARTRTRAPSGGAEEYLTLPAAGSAGRRPVRGRVARRCPPRRRTSSQRRRARPTPSHGQNASYLNSTTYSRSRVDSVSPM